MFRKLTATLLCLLLLSGCALADGSILPPLTTPAPDAGILPEVTVHEAISFGVEMNVYPTRTAALSTGEWQETYANVTPAQYRSFGVILGDAGYAAEDVSVEESFVALTLVKDDLRIAFRYDQTGQLLVMTYPPLVVTGIDKVSPQTAMDHVNAAVNAIQGAVDENIPSYGENDPFEGFTEIALGETIDLAITDSYTLVGNVDLRLTPTRLHWQEPAALCRTYPGDQYVLTGETAFAWLEATVTNLGSRDAAPDDLRTSLSTSILTNSGITLHYVNADGHYAYPATAGMTTAEGRVSVGEVKSSLLGEYTARHTVSSLDTAEFVFCFLDVPEKALNAQDGLLALTFIPTKGERYVYYLRK